MPNSSRIAVATVAAAVLTSSWAALIFAAPASADPLYDLCTLEPAEDPCHVVFNVPVDPSIPHRTPDPYPTSIFPPDNSNDLSNPMNPNSILSPLNPMNPNNPSNPANPSSPLNPANNQPHS